jgi:endonuclease YncB( thermonuclease family)
MRNVLLILLLLSCGARAETLTGRARVLDGDTLNLGERYIRLEGVDAPETDQTCLDQDGKHWNCGLSARDALDKHVGESEIECQGSKTDSYLRLLATCRARGEDLNRWLVSEGWALSYTQYSRVYERDEVEARENNRGLWRGCFIAPWAWRHLTLATRYHDPRCPDKVQEKFGVPELEAPSPCCVIKGNVSAFGRIYHLPGCSRYRHVKIIRGTERRWFCGEDEATAAGWRRPRIGCKGVNLVLPMGCLAP